MHNDGTPDSMIQFTAMEYSLLLLRARAGSFRSSSKPNPSAAAAWGSTPGTTTRGTFRASCYSMFQLLLALPFHLQERATRRHPAAMVGAVSGAGMAGGAAWRPQVEEVARRERRRWREALESPCLLGDDERFGGRSGALEIWGRPRRPWRVKYRCTEFC